MFSDIVTALIEKIKGSTRLQVFNGQAPDENQTTPYIIFDIIPNTTKFQDFWKNEEEPKFANSYFRMLFTLTIFGDNNKGHKIVYDVADEMRKQLHHKRFECIGGANTQTRMMDYGTCIWDAFNTVTMESIYLAEGSVLNTGDN